MSNPNQPAAGGPTTQPQIALALGPDRAPVNSALEQLAQKQVIARLWEHDYTLWADAPTEITNRLGWLHAIDAMLDNLDCLQALAGDLRAQGYTHALLLGMGGSSLAPEVFRETFGIQPGYLDLAVLDSTDPAAVNAYAARLPLEKTLFIVATKSGGTAETLSFFKFFYNQTVQAVGEQQAGQHFIAITDPGSPLAQLAADYDFRTVFLNDPNIGGRYSALSYFGLVPAALIGVDLETLLNRALGAASDCGIAGRAACTDNPGAVLGVVLSTLAQAGRDKLTLVASSQIASFVDWVEQLIAESTGKDGVGILPVVGEPLGAPNVYGSDRLFVHLRLDGDDSQDQAVLALEEAGHPIVRLHLRDLYDLGRQFFQWEMATAIAGCGLEINPFDQPNVEAAKKQARAALDAYIEAGALPEQEPSLVAQPLTVYGAEENPGSVSAALRQFLAERREGDYVALLAYVDRSPDNVSAVHQIASHIETSLGLPTTVGFGPRYLHSTGQLHKGGPASVLAIEITAQSSVDLKVPDAGYTFGLLKKAQALGDQAALRESNRRVMRVDIGSDVAVGLEALAGAVAQAVREASE